jgi:3'-5' exoribonuclease
MKSAYVADLAADQSVTTLFLVCEKELRTGNSGKPYLRLSLGDRTGAIEARMWENFEKDAAGFSRDDFVKVQGRVDLFNGKRQLRVERIRRAEPHEVQIEDYFPHTREDVKKLWAVLRQHVAAVRNPWLLKLLTGVLEDPAIAARYQRAPAAKSMHHAFIGGLLEHVVSLCGLCRAVAGHYPEADADLLITAAVLHDIGKLEELTYERSIGYSDDGQLLGHILIGLEMVGRRMEAIPGFPAELQTLVKHLLASHHGKYEFGSPKLPQFREAVLFNFLDDMDSKMASMRASLEAEGGEGDWTAYNAALGRYLLRVEKYLAAEPSAGGQDKGSNAASATAGPQAQLPLK